MREDSLGTQPAVISEWDWFRAQLDLSALDRSRRQAHRIYYLDGDPDEDDPPLKCTIAVPSEPSFVPQTAHSEELIQGWIVMEKEEIERILSSLEGLRQEFSMELHVRFNISSSLLGMGTRQLASYQNGSVQWI